MTPDHYVGVVMIVVCLPINLAFAILFHSKRNDRYINLRYPLFSAISNFGLFLSTTILSLNMIIYPNMKCGVMAMSGYIILPIYVLPMVFKAIGYGLRFYLHEKKARSRIELVETSHNAPAEEKSAKLWIYLIYLSSPYLLIAFCVCLFLSFVLAVAETGVYYDFFSNNMLRCYPFNTYRFEGMVVFYILIVVGVALLIRKSKDALNIKQEFIYMIIISVITMIIYFVYSILGMDNKLGLRAGIFLLVGTNLCFGVSTIWPCVHVIKAETKIPSCDLNSQREFATALENLHFRNCFYEFLKLQFCAEHLLCWEAIYNWNQTKSYSNDQAQNIFDKFIRTDAPFELNIAQHQRREIENRINCNERNLDSTTFQQIEKDIVHELYLGSYRQFLRSPLSNLLDKMHSSP